MRRILHIIAYSIALFFLWMPYAVSQDTGAQQKTITSASESSRTTDSPLNGIWENDSRFVEFTADSELRIVLKPYYGFVYEDTGWIPFHTTNTETTEQAANNNSSANLSSPDTYPISVKYNGEKYEQLVPIAVIGNGMYFRFYRKSEAAATTDSSADKLNGFWMAAGNADGLRLYRSDVADEFFCYYFDNASYYRIRYWATDARFKDLHATFSATNGKSLSVPKFINIGGVLYTCITSTGTLLRNYESGSYTVKDGAISFKPNVIVYAGTTAAFREPTPYTVSNDGQILALGKPYLSRSKITDLDAEIEAHNGLRRPPRKPILEYMDLDFHWEEIERIRNNGRAPSKQ